MKSKARLLLFFFLTGIFLLAGCQTAKKPATEKKTSPSQVTESDKRVMANNFSNIAMGVEGVNKATVVIASADATVGQTTGSEVTAKGNKNGGKMIVMVGLVLNPQANASAAKQNTAKNTVKTKILASDKRIDDVLVTTDANMVKKINDVAAGLIEGKPVLSYAKSAAELGKMMKTQLK